jgi:hypothetical protein
VLREVLTQVCQRKLDKKEPKNGKMSCSKEGGRDGNIEEWKNGKLESGNL